MVQDPAGHFVELVQTASPPPAAAGSNANIVGVRVRHTVENLERSLPLYRDALGLQGSAEVPPYHASRACSPCLGFRPACNTASRRSRCRRRVSSIELLEFKGARRAAAPARIQDPGSTRIQLRVADIDAAVAALTQAGGTFMSTGGKPLDLPAGNTTLKVGIVRDPDGLFIVLIQAPPAPR